LAKYNFPVGSTSLAKDSRPFVAKPMFEPPSHNSFSALGIFETGCLSSVTKSGTSFFQCWKGRPAQSVSRLNECHRQQIWRPAVAPDVNRMRDHARLGLKPLSERRIVSGQYFELSFD
jgi:hypothetical protein